jgi:hypothetical protein
MSEKEQEEKQEKEREKCGCGCQFSTKKGTQTAKSEDKEAK